jgi:hypothetical protein
MRQASGGRGKWGFPALVKVVMFLLQRSLFIAAL